MAAKKNKFPTIKVDLAKAIALQRSGQFAAAYSLCEKFLKIKPRNVTALHLRGVLATQLGTYELAIKFLGLAIQYSPPSAALYSNRGIALQKSQQLVAAIDDFDRAIAIQPDHSEAHLNRGAALIAIGQLREGIESFETAIAIRPDFVLAHLNLGRVLRELGRLDAAANSFSSALVIQPDLIEALEALAKIFLELKQWESAVSVLQRVVVLTPNNARICNDFGVALHQSGRLSMAVQWFSKAIALAPNLSLSYANYGGLLRDLGRYPESIQNYDLSMSLDREDFEALNDRALTRQAMGDLSAALEDFARALAVQPDHGDIRTSQAMALLMAGDYRTGWAAYEWRWRTANAKLQPRVFQQPLWLGAEPLSDRTILLHVEQGLGDTLQFSRYIPLLVERGARVILVVPPPLLRLMQEFFQGLSRYSAQDAAQESAHAIAQGAAAPTSAAVEVLAAGRPLPDFDYHCPLMSLPLAFATDLTTIPQSHPYLVADPDRAQVWGQRLGPRHRLRVGLVWSGGARPDQPELRLVNERRNLPPSKLEPLATVTADFYSLQKGEPAVGEFKRQLAAGWNGPMMIDFTDELNDFADTAALIANLDLVISVDTSTAHLAAAMGKPVWILNRFDTCWRWMLDRRDSPWYPTITLYRQTRPGVWDDVIESVRTDLEALVRANR